MQSMQKTAKRSAQNRTKGVGLRASKKHGVAKKAQENFSDLKTKVVPILKPYVNRISVFGSLARGQARPSSDIDLLIALKPAEARPVLGLIKFISLEQALEKKLGREVDLITEDELNVRRKRSIEKDRVVIYEAGQG